jgi:hypothetical protein
MQPNRRANPSGHTPPPAADHLNLPGIRVTDRWFLVGQRRFDVTELHNLRTVRGPHHPLAIRSGLCSVAGVALIGLFFRQLQPAGALGAVSAVLILAGVSIGVGLRRPRSHELWADYRGMTVQLYYSDDERRYGAVSRAIIRARESSWRASSTRSPSSAAAAAQSWYSQAA